MEVVSSELAFCNLTSHSNDAWFAGGVFPAHVQTSGGEAIFPRVTVTWWALQVGAPAAITSSNNSSASLPGLPINFTPVVDGSSVTLQTNVSGMPTPSVQWQVSYDNVTWINVPGGTGANLTIAGVNASMFGWQYRAVYTSQVGTVVGPATTLYVESLPFAIVSPINVTVLAGHSLQLNSSAMGHGLPTADWEWTTDQLPNRTWLSMPADDQSSVAVSTIQLSTTLSLTAGLQAGLVLYRVRYTNGAGDAYSANACVNITAAPVSAALLSTSSSGLAAGSIAAIVICSLIGALLCCGCCYWCLLGAKRRERRERFEDEEIRAEAPPGGLLKGVVVEEKHTGELRCAMDSNGFLTLFWSKPWTAASQLVQVHSATDGRVLAATTAHCNVTQVQIAGLAADTSYVMSVQPEGEGLSTAQAQKAEFRTPAVKLNGAVAPLGSSPSSLSHISILPNSNAVSGVHIAEVTLLRPSVSAASLATPMPRSSLSSQMTDRTRSDSTRAAAWGVSILAAPPVRSTLSASGSAAATTLPVTSTASISQPVLPVATILTVTAINAAAEPSAAAAARRVDERADAQPGSDSFQPTTSASGASHGGRSALTAALVADAAPVVTNTNGVARRSEAVEVSVSAAMKSTVGPAVNTSASASIQHQNAEPATARGDPARCRRDQLYYGFSSCWLPGSYCGRDCAQRSHCSSHHCSCHRCSTGHDERGRPSSDQQRDAVSSQTPSRPTHDHTRISSHYRLCCGCNKRVHGRACCELGSHGRLGWSCSARAARLHSTRWR